MEAKDSGDCNAILGADKLLTCAYWEAEKLLTFYYQPPQKIQIEYTGPLIIMWEQPDVDATSIGIVKTPQSTTSYLLKKLHEN